MRSFGSPFFNFKTTSIKEVFDKISRLVALCERTAPCASDTLLDESDPAVLAELDRRETQAGKTPTSGHNVSTAIVTFDQAGLVWGDVAVQPSHIRSPWFDVLADGVKTALTYSLKTNPDALMRDIGQSLNRLRHSKGIPDPMKPDSSKHRHFSQMPQQQVWITHPGCTPRLMIGRESMMIQGFPIMLHGLEDLLHDTLESTMMSLGGNAMASHVVLPLLQATFASAPWNGTTSTCHHFGIEAQKLQLEQVMSLLTVITKPAGTAEAEDSDDETPRYKTRRTVHMK